PKLAQPEARFLPKQFQADSTNTLVRSHHSFASWPPILLIASCREQCTGSAAGHVRRRLGRNRVALLYFGSQKHSWNLRWNGDRAGEPHGVSASPSNLLTAPARHLSRRISPRQWILKKSSLRLCAADA